MGKLLLGVMIGLVLGAAGAEAARARRPIALHNSELVLRPVSADAGRSYTCQLTATLAATNSTAEDPVTVVGPRVAIPSARTGAIDAVYLGCANASSTALDLPTASPP